MTTPEESRPKTDSTNDALLNQQAGQQNASHEDTNGATGRTMSEALEEAGLAPQADESDDETNR
ncbi:hypothetical protein [Streptomyces sp. NPDC046939]|uniref:hypothetical protein n=1 Tax=Streptomyces sp. NPDC046939 TaxID=3155376 RepID=UPI0033EBF5D7